MQTPRDENRISTLMAVSNVDGITPVTLWADPVTHRLLVDFSAPISSLTDVNIVNPLNGEVLAYNSVSQKWENSAAGSGSVTSVSVVSANGFAGTVATAGTTPAITLTTTITGVLKGNGTAISAATSGTDFAPATSGTAILKGNGSGGFSSASAGTDYLAPTGLGTGLTITSRTVGNSTNLDTALGNLDSALNLLSMNGFSSWTSGVDASTYSIGGGNFTLIRSGQGFIASKLITWIANQTIALASISANTAGWAYIDSTGTLSWTTTAATAYAAIPLFYIWYDGTNYFVEKENHNYNFESRISSYLHNTINVVIRSVGAVIVRSGSGTGAAVADREIKITGADNLDDHGLSCAIAEADPITVMTVYLDGTGKWIQYHSQAEITPYYNNAGTPTALDATPNTYCVYTIYALQDDINSSTPRYMAVMDDAAYANLSDAQAAITAGTVTYASNEIKTIEPCQLGYAILQYSATGGYVNSVVVARNTFNQSLVGGGTGAATNHAFLTNLDFANSGHTGFTSPTTTDTFTNKTYDTAGTGNVFKINGTAISDKTGTGKAVLDTSPTLVTPLLGTPTSGTLTNCTGLPISGLVSSTSTALGVGSIELGHATDTTIARVSAGVISVEGVTVPTETSTNTLTNKRITKRTGSTTSSATPTINTDNVDMYLLTAQAADITSFTTNLSGTPTEGQTLWIAITGTAARAITWGTSFEASTVALPTTTVTTNRLDVGFVWNSVTSKWRCIATA